MRALVVAGVVMAASGAAAEPPQKVRWATDALAPVVVGSSRCGFVFDRKAVDAALAASGYDPSRQDHLGYWERQYHVASQDWSAQDQKWLDEKCSNIWRAYGTSGLVRAGLVSKKE